MNKDLQFQDRLNRLASLIPPQGHSEVQRLIACLTKAGVVDEDSLIDILLNSRLPESLRLDACWLLPRLEIRNTEEILISLLSDSHENLCAEAASGLGLLASSSVIEPLILCLENHDSKVVKLAVIHALGILSRSESAANLLRILENEFQDEDLRADAAEALAHVPGEAIVDALIKALRDSSALVQYSAAYALGEQGSRLALPALRSLSARSSASTKYGEVASCAQEAVESILNRST